MKKNLVITNYDNFKDLSYFIGQHKIALGMLDEIEKFYLAFLKSKLIYSLDISKFPGKIIKQTKVYKNTIHLDSKYDEKIFNTVKPGDTFTDFKQGNNKPYKPFTVIKVGKTQNCWNQYKTRTITIRYNDDDPKIEYHNLLSAVFCSTHTHSDKFLWPKEEDYNNQSGVKKELENEWKKEKSKFYIITGPNGEFFYFCSESELPEYKFTLSDDSSKLIVYKDTYSGGTETDRWKTFSYEGYTRTSFSFDVNTGNFLKKDEDFIYTRRTEMKDMHNGWHPYDDD